MRVIVWLLILFNLGLFTYFNIDELFGKNQVVSSAPISPEKIRLLSETDILKLPKKVTDIPIIQTQVPATLTTAIPLETSCYEWGSFSLANLKNAQNALNNLAIASQVKSQSAQEALRYWVYIPRLKSTAAAEAKVAELNAQGVTDVFIVQEPKWKNAISLGVFSDEKLAKQHLDDLKAIGINNVAKRLRNDASGNTSLLTSAITNDTASKLSALKPEFPDSILKKSACN